MQTELFKNTYLQQRRIFYNKTPKRHKNCAPENFFQKIKDFFNREGNLFFRRVFKFQFDRINFL